MIVHEVVALVVDQMNTTRMCQIIPHLMRLELIKGVHNISTNSSSTASSTAYGSFRVSVTI